jgi:uncharacterized protein (TIGR02246 family)
MIRVLLVVGVLGSAVAAFGQTPSQTSSVAAEVRAQEQRMWDNWKNRDFTAMAAHMSADARFLGSDGDQSKAQLVEAMKKSNCSIKGVTLQDVHVIVTGPSAAVITYKSILDGACDGKPLPRTGDINTSVWAKRGGRWLTIAHHQSPLAR